MLGFTSMQNVSDLISANILSLRQGQVPSEGNVSPLFEEMYWTNSVHDRSHLIFSIYSKKTIFIETYLKLLLDAKPADVFCLLYYLDIQKAFTFVF